MLLLNTNRNSSVRSPTASLHQSGLERQLSWSFIFEAFISERSRIRAYILLNNRKQFMDSLIAMLNLTLVTLKVIQGPAYISSHYISEGTLGH